MRHYTASTFGDSWAGIYDESFPDVDPDMIDRLVELSDGGAVLELGIGTGRVALPLHQRGVTVEGIDASSSMLERLQAKPGGSDIPVKIATFSEFDARERYRLVFVVFNTIFALLTQREQVSCFRSVARILEPGGRFLIEAFVPDQGRFDRGQSVRVVDVTDEAVRLDCCLHDTAAQTVTGQTVQLSSAGVALYPVRIRYAWPAELDLMAQLEGLKLLTRWGGWRMEPFTSDSASHVSLYGKDPSEE